MNTVLIWQTNSTSSVATEQLGEHIGHNVRGGEVFELVSDLGGGKTTFTRGLVRGTGSIDTVGSPTFTLSREYEATKFKIAHFDFYRLSEAGIVADELAEIIGDTAYVTVVEWGDIVHDVLPTSTVTVRISLDASDENARAITMEYTQKFSYLLEGLV